MDRRQRKQLMAKVRDAALRKDWDRCSELAKKAHNAISNGRRSDSLTQSEKNDLALCVYFSRAP